MSHDRLPLYMQIQDYFKERIASGQLRTNDKIPSEKELMERFGVSRITVANALVQLAKDGWIQRIPGRGSFVAEMPEDERRDRTATASEARGLGEGAHEASGDRRPGEGAAARKRIGLIIPTVQDFFAIRLISGVNEVLKTHGYDMYVALSNNEIETERRLVQDSVAYGTSGLIIFPSDAETYNEEILTLKMSGYPFVLIDRYLAGIDTNIVCTDGRQGAQMALDHLYELGHREIAICSDTKLPTTTVSDRLAGYMEALKQREELINPAMILTDFEVDYSDIRLDHPLCRFIRSGMATAYIALNARLGVHIANIAKQVGLRVPEDISILTFDDPSSGYDEAVSFTHISQSEFEMGKEAAEILIQQLEGGARAGEYSKSVKQPKLIVRASTGPARTPALTESGN